MDQTHSEVDSSNAHTPDTLPTLTEFLTQLKLLRYHAAFTSAGVADDDIPQLVLLEESDLRELLESIGMLPFHAIAFRSTLRLLRRQHSPKNAREVEHKSATPSPRLKTLDLRAGVFSVDLDPASAPDSIPVPDGFRLREIPTYLKGDGEIKTISKQVIISHATIYGKNSTRALTPYEKAINDACIKLALSNPVLLADKGAMLEHAKKKLLADGYTYKRGQSRSKLNPNARSGDATKDFKQRRNKTAEKLSLERRNSLIELEGKLHECILSRRQAEAKIKLGLKESTLDELEEIKRNLDTAIKEKTRIGKEISRLKAQERKHQWYEKQKSKRRADSGYGEVSFLEDDAETTASQRSFSESEAGSRPDDDGMQSQDSAIADCHSSQPQNDSADHNQHSSLEALSIAAIAAAAAEKSALGGVETRARKRLRSIFDEPYSH
ncbi:hypothetical protein VKS41_001918 [Umbelopsis sp. WA50703]